jgi:FkbM family methyltransferase
MYSQNKEEEVILNHFKSKFDGRFLDIGAFHPFSLSNTRCLFERGWGGVFVEPNQKQVQIFKEEYDDIDRIEICDCALDEKSGDIIFYTTDCPTLSTTTTEHFKKWGKKYKFSETKVKSISTEDFFDKYGYDFDFISLDVESTNWKLLNMLPFNKLNNLDLICVEYDNKYNEIINFMNNLGFTLIAKNGENVIMKKRDKQ